ncbi:hypothetical protein M0811_03231 [Anaeramoeba ignava]|uniref:Uncharacterized protein n=1 Tax=Anaeramoeba ignava TaxID=1746090 RepID=A0A9Q0L5V7_ANAIG|nr:hypothetical protein M0811_03231 [Anaeramoeba ignava]|eukprot:Anaeramoba_ignava/a91890_47.p1 GENE.a91890_47~~a91890_47.p1  ORF type:complete len:362 (-),score=109.04 a91890_47:190-1275(-)
MKEIFGKQILRQFQVEKIQLADIKFAKMEIKKKLSDQINKKVETTSEAKNLVNVTNSMIGNGFVQAAFAAYSLHYPIVFSPDDIWILLAQGFSTHINLNAEKFRDQFVAHDGKKEIQIDGIKYGIKRNQENNNWQGVINEFTQIIDQNLKSDTKDLIEANFSTTTQNEKVASQIILMEAMQKYFKYSVHLLCGLSEVTLLGTVDDWISIRTKAEKFSEFGMSWWLKHLLPVLDQFVSAAKGEKIKPKFWKKICKKTGHGSGPRYLNGWITSFFPYLWIDESYVQNPGMRGKNKKVNLNHFPLGLSSAPFILNDNGDIVNMRFYAGFVGVDQDEKTLALKSSVGWAAVLDKNETEDYFNEDF